VRREEKNAPKDSKKRRVYVKGKVFRELRRADEKAPESEDKDDDDELGAHGKGGMLAVWAAEAPTAMLEQAADSGSSEHTERNDARARRRR
jgi:hypothetical protein